MESMNINQLIASDQNIAPEFRQLFEGETEHETQRMDLILAGNHYAALSFLQHGILHLLWPYRRHATPDDFLAALRIQSAERDVMSDALKRCMDRIEEGLHAK